MIVFQPTLKFVTIADRGVPNTERIHFEVLRDCDSSLIILLATLESTPGSVFAGLRPAYWFEQKRLKAGDTVVVYTGKGSYFSRQLIPPVFGEPNSLHFFFWGCDTPLFAIPTARVIIADINSWQTG